jgi:SPP1 family predicted phage head-tail adaptor
MKAGSLDRLITIEAPTVTLDDAGAPSTTWSTFATMRAQLVKNSTADDERRSGSETDERLTFRMHYLDGVTLNHRLTYQGQAFEIRDLAEIGRRRGLEVIARRFGP